MDVLDRLREADYEKATARELSEMFGDAIQAIERLRSRVAGMKARQKAALDLLEEARCPRCGGAGYVYPVSPLDGEPYPDACDWCRIYAALAAKEE